MVLLLESIFPAEVELWKRALGTLLTYTDSGKLGTNSHRCRIYREAAREVPLRPEGGAGFSTQELQDIEERQKQQICRTKPNPPKNTE